MSTRRRALDAAVAIEDRNETCSFARLGDDKKVVTFSAARPAFTPGGSEGRGAYAAWE
jgi:hypothetical protein